jgi:thiopeptide-type bacteriocin biosynthesis protein
VAEFLRQCAASLDPVGAGPGCGAGVFAVAEPGQAPELTYARDVFVRAGLAALADVRRSDWYQIGLTPPTDHERRAGIYRRIAGLVRELLADRAIDNFFYLHKPPGLRLRFESAPAGIAGAIIRIRAAVADWQRDGLVSGVEPGVYEPENRLFGGPVSMAYVHRVFTADSLAWLDFHADESDRAAGGPGADWALSLVMMRGLLDGLDIGGWEDIDVWDRIREKTGRRLPREAIELARLSGVGSDILACWLRPERLLAHLGPAGRRIADEYCRAVVAIGREWRTGYFATDAAYLGPRSVAAFVTIFHWNRAALPMLRQSLLAEALASREAAVQ